ncbi:Sodium/calcium exchanger protein-domain-containing protein [Lactifluus subvellereus]|nr:Sodium/calcium exchanger protein-domain-containing protein [Lactifluus subvellereus]
MPSTERTPLLDDDLRFYESFYSKIATLLKAEGEPSLPDSYRWFLLGPCSWLNSLLLLAPVATAAHYLHWDAPLRFAFSFIAIIPLAKLLGDATEQISFSLGPTLAGLLNATFGNAIEIIVGLTALLQGEVRIVQTAMLGSILSNILLCLGCSFLAGGLCIKENEFQVTAAQTSVFVISFRQTLVIPAAYHSAKRVNSLLIADSDEGCQKGLLIISRGTAILLFCVYIAYLIFQLKTHASLFEVEEDTPNMSVVAASLGLLFVTIITSSLADYMVASIEETANRLEISKAFIGLILLPVVSNASEQVASICMAKKDKMELSIGICVGSSIQIATFVIPLLVVIGWISGHELTLFFDDFEVCTAFLIFVPLSVPHLGDDTQTVTFFVSVLLVNLLVQDGKSNYMEGLMLVTLYFVIALACASSLGNLSESLS